MPNYVPVAGYRSRVDSIPGGIEITIPSPRNYFIIAFIGFWLCGWVFGLVTSGGLLLFPPHVAKGAPPGLFLFVWLCAWVLAGIFAITVFLWNLAGRERIAVGSDALSIRREACGVGWSRHYELRAAKGLRIVESGAETFFGGFGRRDPFGLMAGPFAFDYGAKTVRFGAGVDVAEAKYLLSKLIAAKPALAGQN